MKPSQLLPILALAACTKTRSNLPDTTAERCAPEIQAVIDACNEANVVGTNENTALYKAVDEAKACIGAKVRITCHDTDMTKVSQFHQF